MNSDRENRAQRITEVDLRILRRADTLLAKESDWLDHCSRTCDSEASRRSLFCALHQASIDVMGQYKHRQAALMVIRWIIEERMDGEEFEHRLMDFNNTRDFPSVKDALSEAISRVQARLL
jgi:hypothetical protein